MSATLDKNHILLDVEIEDDFTLYGHANEMTQAIVNIVNNAKDVLIERKVAYPQIRIKASREGDKSLITIEDNAGGIEINPIEKIFEPYFSTKHASIGTGIGLYMTKTIIEKNNNGTITIANTEQGARFIITLYDKTLQSD
jgi:signal transduction histidine kinase